jgi:hypothetical protein
MPGGSAQVGFENTNRFTPAFKGATVQETSPAANGKVSIAVDDPDPSRQLEK